MSARDSQEPLFSVHIPQFDASEQPQPTRPSSRTSAANAIIACSDGRERFCKKQLGDAPYIPVHELLAASLGNLLSFPVFSPCLVNVDGVLWFGRDFVPPERIAGFAFGPKWDSTVNRSELPYQAVCFDAWILNADRHDDNVLLRAEDGNLTSWRGFLHDHARAFGGDNLPAEWALSRVEQFTADFDSWVPDSTAWLHKQATWLRHIERWERVQEVAGMIQSLEDVKLRAAIDAIPAAWVTTQYREALCAFVTARRDALPSILDRHRSRFKSSC